MMEATEITEVTPITMPSTVSAERTLCRAQGVQGDVQVFAHLGLGHPVTPPAAPRRDRGCAARVAG